MKGPEVHVGPTADEERAKREAIANAGRDKQLYGVAPELMRVALKSANRKLANEKNGQAQKKKNRKKNANAKKARRLNR